MTSQYPLEEVLAIKKDRVEKARKNVDLKRQELQKEQEKFAQVEQERNQIVQHRAEKIKQLKDAFDQGTTSEEILQKKAYIKIVDEKVQQAQKKVAQQKEVVKKAENALDEAKKAWKQRSLEEEKIVLHKEEWQKQEQKELDRQEQKQQDELGQLTHESLRKRKQER